jgi:hypothetical protein
LNLPKARAFLKARAISLFSQMLEFLNIALLDGELKESALKTWAFQMTRNTHTG